MAVDFTFTNIINIIANEFFMGNTTITALALMLAASLILMMILSSIKAPVTYALAPMIIMSIIFNAMGMMDSTVSFIIIILSAIVMAASTRRLVES